MSQPMSRKRGPRVTPEMIYHLAIQAEWDEAVREGGEYRRSTIGRSLEEEGFIHCSFAEQVDGVRHRFYGGRDDVVVLSIDPALVPSPIRTERPEGATDAFPHIYGPLPLGAVVATST